jgi:hypothetical protein
MHSIEAAATPAHAVARTGLRGRCLVVLLVLIAGLPAARAPAQSVYRCVQKGKPVSLQSEPCDSKATTTGIRGYVPERTPTAHELAWKRYRTEQEMAARNRAARQSSITTTVNVPVDNPDCAQAKAARDAWERQMGLQRSIDGMRYWQDRVYRACR